MERDSISNTIKVSSHFFISGAILLKLISDLNIRKAISSNNKPKEKRIFITINTPKIIGNKKTIHPFLNTRTIIARCKME